MRDFNSLKIAVAGTGYVGLSIATLLSQHHEVHAVDVLVFKTVFTVICTSEKFEYLIAVVAVGLAVMIAYIYSIFINIIMKNKKKIICD